MASQIGTLFSFTPSTTAQSSQVNQNFTDIKTAFNALLTASNTLASGLNALGMTRLTITAPVAQVTALQLSGWTANDATTGISLAGTFTNGGSSAAFVLLNLTDTTPPPGNHILKLQTGGSDRFTFQRDGVLTITAQSGFNAIQINGGRDVQFGPSAIATSATQGFVYLPNCTGAPTGVPTGSGAPLVYDTTNNKLWVRFGGTWRGVVLA